MSPSDAVSVSEFTAVDVAADGGSAVFSSVSPDGPVRFVVPAEQLPALFGLASQAHAQAQKIAAADPSLKTAHPVEWWEISQIAGSDLFAMSFRIPGGLEMTFALHLDRAPQIAETLQVLAGVAPETPTGQRS